MSKNSTKSKSKYRMPDKLWKLLKKHLPKEPKVPSSGRPRAKNRDVIDGIWYVLWTGCQWKSIEKERFGVCSSVLHERFKTWQTDGLFEKLFNKMVKYYARVYKIGWKWQSVDSMMSASPLGSKVHLLVDERGAPWAIWITGANEHDKWFVDDLIVHIVAKRPNSEQHFCADKAYDFDDVYEFVGLHNYIEHIKYRRRRNEPKDECQIPGEKTFPARRWVVERTFCWLSKRRSVSTRWCKKSQNWLAFVHMACSQILLK